MKGGLVAAAAAVLAGGASAHINHQHAHDLFHKRGYGENEVCSTVWTTITGAPTLCQPSTSIVAPVTTAAPATTTPEVCLPTPQPHTCPTPGTYTFTPTTITVSATTTVCAYTSTSVPSGTHTIGGVTTVVESSTVVTCPVASTGTSAGVTTSTIILTTHVCPSAGTYTIAPTTTAVTTDTTIVYVVPTTICPGTYTAPETVVTVTETDYTTWCPLTSCGPTSTAAAVTTQAPPPPAYTSQPAAQPTSSPSGGGYGGGGYGGSLGASSGPYAISYTCYDQSTGDCKTAESVDSDIAAIAAAGFKVIRTYSTDCSTLESVGAACRKYGLDIMMGVFVKETGCTVDTSDIEEQVQAIATSGLFDITKLIIVGNEAIASGYCSAEELSQLVVDVKSACNGYTGPYTIAETLDIWQESDVSSCLCEVVDITGANLHPFFNSATTPETAGQFVASELEILGSICPGKQPFNLECGWPTAGDCNGSACPGESEQAEAIKNILETSGGSVVFFSPYNDMWKSPGSFDCEQYWGCLSQF